jgi:hypothetical protein
MRLIGVEKWAMEEAKEIRSRCFKGEFIVGKEPARG